LGLDIWDWTKISITSPELRIPGHLKPETHKTSMWNFTVPNPEPWVLGARAESQSRNLELGTQNSNTRNSIFSIWYSVFSICYLELGTLVICSFYKIPGTQYSLPGTRHLVICWFYEIPGTQYLLPGTRHIEQCPELGTQYPELNIQYLVFSICCPEFNTWWFVHFMKYLELNIHYPETQLLVFSM
jgi:hypothetical protein